MNIFKLCLAAGILFALPSHRADAQITPDGSTSTTVNNNGNVSTIEAGDRAGTNLFHSFDSFSVPNGNEAFFNNAADIENIFSRVTGGNISSIDGAIRANNVNLFLINPAGIVLGNGARLDVGGAFYGSTADSIIFPDNVEFSAISTNAPTLTINAPIGLSFRENPSDISLQSDALSTTGQDIHLYGGNINLDNATINALGRTVSLGAIAQSGIINFNENLKLDLSNVALADITLNNSQINVNGAGGGEIKIDARNLSLSDNSTLSAGINSDTSTAETRAGNIIINASENVNLDSGSIIRINLSQVSSGNAGDILIMAENLVIANNSRLATISAGNGNTGSINLDIRESTSLSQTAEIKSEISAEGIGNGNNIQINSGSVSLSNNSQLLADVKGTGDGGDIVINTETLSLTAGSDFSSNLSGTGNAGSINVTATDAILLEGSTFQTRVLSGGEGNAGNIDLNTSTLTLSNDTIDTSQSSSILASTAGTGEAGNINIQASNSVSLDNDSSIQTQVESSGVGNAGNIFISTTDLSLTDGTKPNRSSLLANSVGEGDGGDITIDASGDIVLDTYGLILSQGTAGTGDAGDINVSSDTLSLSTGSVIISTTGDAENLDVPNSGDAGNIIINSRIATLQEFSGISSSSFSNATGQAGDITLNAEDLTIAGGSGVNALTENTFDGGTIEVNAGQLDLTTGAGIVTLTNGSGNAGDINLNVDGQITIDGANPLIPPEEFRSPVEVIRELEEETGLFANTTDTSTGNGGNIQISTPNTLTISNGGQITVNSEGTGNGGNLLISAGDLDLNSGSKLIAITQAGQPEQEPSNINLQIENILSLQGDSQISAQAFSNANGGNVIIDAEFVIAFAPEVEGNDIIANAIEGAGGRIDITAQEIFGLQEGKSEPGNARNDLDVSSEFGFDGSISINAPDLEAKAGIRDLPTSTINPANSVQQACSANNAIGSSSLSLQGRGGIPAAAASTLSSDNILFDGQFSEAERINFDATNVVSQQEQPIDNLAVETARGKLYPARGIITNGNGEIILTRSDNQNIQRAQSVFKPHCLTNKG